MRRMLVCFVIFLLMPEKIGVATDSCRNIPAEKNSLMGTGNMNELPGPAVIFGDPVTIPAFHLRFIDGKTKKEVSPSKIDITYDWKWLRYPYPEHSWGVWDDTYDQVECIEPGAEILVHEFKVQPRGWYDGKYVKFPFIGKRPSFTGIGVVMYDVGCNKTPWVTLSPKDVSKLKKNNLVTIEINCAGHLYIIIK